MSSYTSDNVAFYDNPRKSTRSQMIRMEGQLQCDGIRKNGILYKEGKREIFFPSRTKELEFIFDQNYDPVELYEGKFENTLEELLKYMETPDFFYIKITDNLHCRTLNISERTLFDFHSIQKVKDIRQLDDIDLVVYCFECVHSRRLCKPYSGRLLNTIIIAKDDDDNALRLGFDIFKSGSNKTYRCNHEYVINIKQFPEGRTYYRTGIEELIFGRGESGKLQGLNSPIFDKNVFRLMSEFI